MSSEIFVSHIFLVNIWNMTIDKSLVKRLPLNFNVSIVHKESAKEVLFFVYSNADFYLFFLDKFEIIYVYHIKTFLFILYF